MSQIHSGKYIEKHISIYMLSQQGHEKLLSKKRLHHSENRWLYVPISSVCI